MTDFHTVSDMASYIIVQVIVHSVNSALDISIRNEACPQTH